MLQPSAQPRCSCVVLTCFPATLTELGPTHFRMSPEIEVDLNTCSRGVLPCFTEGEIPHLALNSTFWSLRRSTAPLVTFVKPFHTMSSKRPLSTCAAATCFRVPTIPEGASLIARIVQFRCYMTLELNKRGQLTKGRVHTFWRSSFNT